MLGDFCESAQFVKCSTGFVNSQKAQIFIETCAIYRSYCTGTHIRESGQFVNRTFFTVFLLSSTTVSGFFYNNYEGTRIYYIVNNL